MPPSSRSMVLASVLSSLPEETKESLSSFLTPKEREEIRGCVSPRNYLHVPSPLEKIHWSWFIPVVHIYAPSEQPLLLQGLPFETAEHLREELSLPSDSSNPITPLAQTFFARTLLHSLTGERERILPPHFLPESPMNPLLSLSKKELVSFIDFLSLYDLQWEMKHIVDTKVLKKIHSLLSKEKQAFLRSVHSRQEKDISSKFILDKWDGNIEVFKSLFHKKGLHRLGCALSGQHPDLTWHLCHQLDIGRGNALFKGYSESPQPSSPYAVEQVEDVMRALKVAS